jgi:glycine dehydrogenase subunit 1
MGAMHMALLGPEGVAKLAGRNRAACHATKLALAEIEGLTLQHPEGEHYNEFVLQLPLDRSAAAALGFLARREIIGGFDLGQWWPKRSSQLLVTATDQTTLSDIQALAAGLSAWLESGVEELEVAA